MLPDIVWIVCSELKKVDIPEWGYWTTIFYYGFFIVIIIFPVITIFLEEKYILKKSR